MVANQVAQVQFAAVQEIQRQGYFNLKFGFPLFKNELILILLKS